MANHLTEEQRKKAEVALEKFKACPICGVRKFSVEDVVIAYGHWGGQTHLDAQAAMLQVICTNCLYIMHFAAAEMGLTK